MPKFAQPLPCQPYVLQIVLTTVPRLIPIFFISLRLLYFNHCLLGVIECSCLNLIKQANFDLYLEFFKWG